MGRLDIEPLLESVWQRVARVAGQLIWMLVRRQIRRTVLSKCLGELELAVSDLRRLLLTLEG